MLATQTKTRVKKVLVGRMKIKMIILLILFGRLSKYGRNLAESEPSSLPYTFDTFTLFVYLHYIVLNCINFITYHSINY